MLEESLRSPIELAKFVSSTTSETFWGPYLLLRRKNTEFLFCHALQSIPQTGACEAVLRSVTVEDTKGQRLTSIELDIWD